MDSFSGDWLDRLCHDMLTLREGSKHLWAELTVAWIAYRESIALLKGEIEGPARSIRPN